MIIIIIIPTIFYVFSHFSNKVPLALLVTRLCVRQGEHEAPPLGFLFDWDRQWGWFLFLYLPARGSSHCCLLPLERLVVYEGVVTVRHFVRLHFSSLEKGMRNATQWNLFELSSRYILSKWGFSILPHLRLNIPRCGLDRGDVRRASPLVNSHMGAKSAW